MSFSLQKANFWKRISAFMFDAILAFCIAFAVLIGFSAIFQTDKYSKNIQTERAAIEQKYEEKYEAENGVFFDLNLNLTEEEFNKLTEEQQQLFKDASEEFLRSKTVHDSYAKLLIFIFAGVSVSLLVGELITFFIIPLFFKNGQTLGKKCFGLAVIRTNSVKASNVVLFVRSMLGLYVMETIVPLVILAMMFLKLLGIVGTITLILFAVLEIGVMIYTKTNSCVHDLLTDTVVVDMASQKIFESQEARIEYEKEEAARKAAEQEGDQRPVALGVFAPKTTPYVKEVSPQPAHAETTETAQAEQAENTTQLIEDNRAESAESEEAEEPAPAIETAKNSVEETEA